MATMDDSSGGGFFDSLQDPRNYGLLAAGLGILANANGPNSRNAIGAGALTGLQAAQQAQQSAALQGYRNLQAAKLKDEIDNRNRWVGLLGGATGSEQDGGLLPDAAPQAPSRGGLANLSLDQVAIIKASGGPDLTEAWKLAHFGQSVAPGATTVLADGTRISNPSLGQGQVAEFQGSRPVAIRNLPGAVESAAASAGATTGAQEAARAKYDLVPVPLPGGGTQLMSRAQAAALLGGDSAGRPASDAAAGPGAPSPAAGLGAAPSPQVVAARAELPKLDTQITQLTSTIDKALNHPGLKYSVGPWSIAPTIPGTDQADFRAIQGQLQGQAFLQAYQSLRGGGAITEVEGQKAENAIARLNSAQSEGAYREALGDLKSVLSTARERAYKQAGVDIPGSDSKEGGGGAASGRKVTRRGVYNGRSVVQYSDGTVEYQ